VCVFVFVLLCVSEAEREGEAASCGRSISLTERSQECLVPINGFLCMCVCVCVCYTVSSDREQGEIGGGWIVE